MKKLTLALLVLIYGTVHAVEPLLAAQKSQASSQKLAAPATGLWGTIKNSTKLKASALMVGAIGLSTWLIVTGHNQEGREGKMSTRYGAALAPITFLQLLAVWLSGQEEKPLDPHASKGFWDPFIPSYKGLAYASSISGFCLGAGWALGITTLEEPHQKKAANSGIPETRFTDIIPHPDVVVREFADQIKNPEKYKARGFSDPKGLLFVGLPGTGKTLTMRAIAGEAGIPIVVTSGAEYDEIYVGSGAGNVRKYYQQARKLAQASPLGKCLLVIDEIDAVGQKRTTNEYGRGSTGALQQLLTELDGFKNDSSVIVVASTNRPDMLDDALKRSGRFNNIIQCKLPGLEDRVALLEHYLAKVPAADVAGFNFRQLMQATKNWSAADLEAAVDQANRIAFREGLEQINIQCLQQGLAVIARNKINGEGLYFN